MAPMRLGLMVTLYLPRTPSTQVENVQSPRPRSAHSTAVIRRGIYQHGMMTGCAAPTGLPRRDQRLRTAAPAAHERPDKDTEILALRHQIAVLERRLGDARPRFSPPTGPSSRPCCTDSRCKRFIDSDY